jgi:hypothetical protein
MIHSRIPAAPSTASRSLETDPSSLAARELSGHRGEHVSVSASPPPESWPDDPRDIGFPTAPAVVKTTASNPWLRCPRLSDLLMPRKTLARHSLHGEQSSPGTRRLPCSTWRCFVVLRADHNLQFSSRPPSSRAFLVGHRKVYSVRCEADVVMTSPTPDLNSCALL